MEGLNETQELKIILPEDHGDPGRDSSAGAGRAFRIIKTESKNNTVKRE